MLLPIRVVKSGGPPPAPEVVEVFDGEELFDGFTTVEDSIGVSISVTGGRTPNSSGISGLCYLLFKSNTSPAVATINFTSSVKRVKLHIKHHDDDGGTNNEKLGNFEINGSSQNPSIITDPSNIGWTDIAIDGNGDILAGSVGSTSVASYYLQWSGESITSLGLTATGYGGGTANLEFYIAEIELGI